MSKTVNKESGIFNQSRNGSHQKQDRKCWKVKEQFSESLSKKFFISWNQFDSAVCMEKVILSWNIDVWILSIMSVDGWCWCEEMWLMECEAEVEKLWQCLMICMTNGNQDHTKDCGNRIAKYVMLRGGKRRDPNIITISWSHQHQHQAWKCSHYKIKFCWPMQHLPSKLTGVAVYLLQNRLLWLLWLSVTMLMARCEVASSHNNE